MKEIGSLPSLIFCLVSFGSQLWPTVPALFLLHLVSYDNFSGPLVKWYYSMAAVAKMNPTAIIEFNELFRCSLTKNKTDSLVSSCKLLLLEEIALHSCTGNAIKCQQAICQEISNEMSLFGNQDKCSICRIHGTNQELKSYSMLCRAQCAVCDQKCS